MTIKTDWKLFAFYALGTLFAGLTFASALVEVSFFAALIFWTVWKFSGGKERMIVQGWNTGIYFLAAFVAFCVLSWFWSEFRPQSAKGALKVLQQFLIFWMAVDIFGAGREWRRFEKLLVVLCAVLFMDAGYQYFTGQDFIRGFAGEAASSGYRLSASFKSYGLFAAFLAVIIPYLAYLTRRAFRESKLSLPTLFLGLLAASGILCLFLTRSRGAILAFCGSVFLLFLFQRRWHLLLALLLMGAGLLFVLPKGMIIHLDADNREQSLVERYYLWDRAVNVIKAKPLGGTGINTYAVAHQKYDKTQNWRVRNYYAHNGYLQIGAEVGLLGLGFFLTGLFLLIRRALCSVAGGAESDESARRWAVLTGVFAFMIMSLVDTIMHNNQSVMLFWLWLGLLAAVSPLKTKTLTP